MIRNRNYPLTTEIAKGQITPPMIMRLHPREGLILPWGPDCSSQVMTAIITSPKPLAEPELR
jgi:hypothetical protein